LPSTRISVGQPEYRTPRLRLRDREQQFARHRQLVAVADNEGFKEFRIVKTGPGGHHPFAEFRVWKNRA
jgi:hypothetical protein